MSTHVAWCDRVAELFCPGKKIVNLMSGSRGTVQAADSGGDQDGSKGPLAIRDADRAHDKEDN